MIDQHTLTLPLGNDDVASAKSRDKNGLITSSRNQTWQFKAATKLHFINYSHAVIVLSSAGLYKSAFSIYSFGETRFLALVFIFSALF